MVVRKYFAPDQRNIMFPLILITLPFSPANSTFWHRQCLFAEVVEADTAVIGRSYNTWHLVLIMAKHRH